MSTSRSHEGVDEALAEAARGVETALFFEEDGEALGAHVARSAYFSAKPVESWCMRTGACTATRL